MFKSKDVLEPSDSSYLIFSIVGISLVLSINLSLTKTILSVISKNSDPIKGLSRLEDKVSKIWGRNGILESIAIGKIFFNSMIIIFLWKWINQLSLPELFYPWKEIVLFTCLGFFTFVSTYMLPNILGQLKPYAFATLSIWVFELNYILFYIPSKLSFTLKDKLLSKLGYNKELSFLTEEEQKHFDDSHQSNANPLEHDEKQMIKNILEFGDTPVKEIMIPRIDIIGLDINTPIEAALSLINQEQLSRIPLYRDNIDHIVGILHLKDFFNAHSRNKKFSLESIAKPAYFVNREKKIDDLLRELRQERTHMAIVLDEYGGTAGIATLEDVLEEIVGEIYDETDLHEVKIEKIRDNTYFANPVVSLADLSMELNLPIETEEEMDVDSLSGLIQAKLGFVPTKGTTLTVDNLFIKILKLDGQRIEKVLLRVLQNEKV